MLLGPSGEAQDRPTIGYACQTTVRYGWVGGWGGSLSKFTAQPRNGLHPSWIPTAAQNHGSGSQHL